jgi:hypothetical protein
LGKKKRSLFQTEYTKSGRLQLSTVSLQRPVPNKLPSYGGVIKSMWKIEGITPFTTFSSRKDEEKQVHWQKRINGYKDLLILSLDCPQKSKLK